MAVRCLVVRGLVKEVEEAQNKLRDELGAALAGGGE